MKTPISPYHRTKIDGGATLLVKERRDQPIVAVNFWVATGSANEDPNVNGISHFFEHIFFKGTEKYPKGEMDRRVKAMGGYNNAATSYEFTHYYIVIPSWHFRTAVDLLADALLHPAIDSEDVEKERMIIREEIRRRDDNPGARLFTLLQEEIFDGTPYAFPILGREESLKNIGARELKAYYGRHYVLPNVVVVVVGDVAVGEAEEVVRKLLKSGAGRRAERPDRRELRILPPERKRDRFEDKDINQVYAAIGFHTPGMTERELIPTLEVAATALGGGKSSRLYQRLLEREKLVSSIEAWHMELRHAGVFGIDTIFRPGREPEVNQCLFEEIRRVIDRGLEDEEIARAKVILRSSFLYENETNGSISGTLGYYEVGFGDADVVLTYLERIDRVGKEEVRAVLDQYLKNRPFARVVIGPKEERI